MVNTVMASIYYAWDRCIQNQIISLTHWGRATHICVCQLTIICSDNGLSPGRRQAIIWTNAGILLIGTIGTNLSEILIEINTVSFNEMRLKMSSGIWRPFCLGLNVLSHCRPFCFRPTRLMRSQVYGNLIHIRLWMSLWSLHRATEEI